MSKKIGHALHLAKSGNLIIKGEFFVKSTLPVYDDTGKKIGYVIETFGPINSPYVSVKLTTERTRKLLGKDLYVKEETKSNAYKR